MGLLEIAIGALVLSVIAGVLGFGGIASGAAKVAKIFFGIFLFLALLLFILLVLGVGALAQNLT